MMHLETNTLDANLTLGAIIAKALSEFGAHLGFHGIGVPWQLQHIFVELFIYFHLFEHAISKKIRISENNIYN